IAKIDDGSEPGTNGKFRVTQSAVSSTDTVVAYSVGGTATPGAGNDYTALPGTVTIPAGSTTADIDVAVLDDSILEDTETVTVTLTGFTAHNPGIVLTAAPADLTATVNITDDEPLVITSSATASVAENTPASTVILDVIATPVANHTIAYGLTGPDAALFAINSLTGEITFLSSPNFEAPADQDANNIYNVTVTATIDFTPIRSTSQNLSITVTAVSDIAPVFVNSSPTFSISENSALGTAVGTVSATDGDLPAETLTYSIFSGNVGGTFAINPATGQITVADSTLLDFETHPTFNLSVKVTDSGVATGTANVTIQLTNVNEALTLSLPSAPQTYFKRGGAVAVDPAASAFDPDNANIDFNGGSLRVTDAAEIADKNDRLGVLSQGTGTGKISVKGSKIFFESSSDLIGTITSGNNGGPLVISLTTGATQTAVNALLKTISFRNTSNSPHIGTRNITVELTNAAGTEHATASKLLNVVDGRQPPVITLSGGALNYVNSAPATAVDAAATVSDSDSPNFSGGKLSVTFTQGTSTSNQLSLLSTGGITLSGKNVLFNGHKLGRLTLGSTSLSVSFSDTTATPAAAQALVRAIAFGTTIANTNLADRVLSFRLTDGDGGSSELVTKTIHVGSQPI
ncbi:MAG: alkaline phosphatase, partial [Planctomycetaceae bacterium]|nr:alkaline phosphatase [Planctomycetaceae bacterium]